MKDEHVLNFRFAKLEDAVAIQELSRKSHVSRQSNPKEGFTGAIYKQQALESILAEELSVTLDDNGKILGYLLICSPDGYQQAFGKTLSESMGEYGYVPKENTYYCAQVCLDQSIKGKGYFAPLMAFGKILPISRGAKYFLAEILEDNLRSRRVSERFGWEYVAKRQALLHEFNGSQDAPQIEVTWMLYELDLAKIVQEKEVQNDKQGA